MRYFYDARQRSWTTTNPKIADPILRGIVIVDVIDDLEKHELAAFLHRLATELEEQTRKELAAKVRTVPRPSPDYGQNIPVAE